MLIIIDLWKLIKKLIYAEDVALVSAVINGSGLSAQAHGVGAASTREKCLLGIMVEEWGNCKGIAALYEFMKLTLKHILF